MRSLLIRWVVMTAAILVAGYVVPGFHISALQTAFIAAVILSLLNAVLRPILVILTLPINFLTLGIFTLVINAALVGLTAKIVKNGFQIDGFGAAFLGALLISIVSTLLGLMIGADKK